RTGRARQHPHVRLARRRRLSRVRHGGPSRLETVLAAVPPPVTVRVPSKINLHLSVGDVRDEGCHDLTAVLQARSLTGEVTGLAGGDDGVGVSGEAARSGPKIGECLAVRAVRALAERVARPVSAEGGRLVSRKGIPVAGGMAGG